MNTLSNVNDRRGGTNPPNDGLTSNVILEVKSHQQDENSNTGVSSLYVPIENNQWFVLRATYNRVEKKLKLWKRICSSRLYTYTPKHYVIQNKNGKKKRVLKPLLPNLVFVYSTQEHLEKLFREEYDLNIEGKSCR